MERERGFTLLEMMVVVAIIAILAAILIPNFTHARAQAATSACMANLKSVATAFELYYTDKQTYPAGTNAAIDGAATGSSGVLSGYLGQPPEDPAAGSGKYYTYTTSTSGGVDAYKIWCPGAHDPSTMKSFAASSSDTTLKYDSTRGVTSSSGAGQ
ncbi:MAG TPA: prepilin-type N-terminal cleavage/methylation domain-containing protein [Candidatus Baltobacteraceae bacterium]|nr:prepilin-type N-terminal cleavage/methylation domain-containing protein [Candidatus Baltobacteraceae bacterium]